MWQAGIPHEQKTLVWGTRGHLCHPPRPNPYSRTFHWRTLLLLHEITDILVERLVHAALETAIEALGFSRLIRGVRRCPVVCGNYRHMAYPILLISSWTAAANSRPCFPNAAWIVIVFSSPWRFLSFITHPVRT